MKQRIVVLTFLLMLLLIPQVHSVYYKVGFCDIPYYARDCAEYEGYLYITDDKGLHIVDISNPEAPQYIACFEILDTCREIEIQGHYAYIANEIKGLLILDISNPISPEIAGSCDSEDFALSLVVEDNIVYLTDRHAGLQIIDVSDPENPLILSTFPTDFASRIDYCDDLIVISNYLGSMQIIDVSNPNSPSLIIDFQPTFEIIQDIKLREDFLFISVNCYGLIIYDISEPESPELISEFTDVYAGSISINNDILTLCCSTQGFKRIDISDISFPRVIGAAQTPIIAKCSYTENDYAFVIDQYKGLQVYNISNPDNPDLIGSTDTPHYACKIGINDNKGYVADNNQYLQIVDFRDPSYLFITNSIGLNGTLVDCMIAGNHAYALSASKIHPLGLQDPVHPVCYSEVLLGNSQNNALAYKDSYIFVASGVGLLILETSNDSAPSVVGQCNVQGGLTDLVVGGDIVYASNYTRGMSIINVSDVENPTVVQHYIPTGITNKNYAIARAGDTIYLAAGSEGLKIFDVSSHYHPQYVRTISYHDDSRFVTKPLIIDNTMIVEDRNWNEILTFNIQNYNEPELISTYRWNLQTSSFDMYDNNLVTTNNYHGVHILDFETLTSSEDYQIPGNPYNLSNYPNPFYLVNAGSERGCATEISFNLLPHQDAELEIFNLKGQLIRCFEIHNADNAHTNTHTVKWDGRNELNEIVASGVYLYSLKIDNKIEAVKKCLLLK